MSWWGFLPESTLTDLQKLNYKIDATLYRSNQIALGSIAAKTELYDIAILSNSSYKILNRHGYIKKNTLNQLRPNEYLKEIRALAPHCIPYIWSVTAYVSRGNILTPPPDTIFDFINLNKEKKKIRLIDEASEIFIRAMIDSKKKCTRSLEGHPYSIEKILSNCTESELNSITDKFKGISEKDFKSSIVFLKNNSKAASYGWHGIGTRAIKTNKNISYFIPKNYPTIGADFVCILNKSYSKKRLNSLISFVKRITNKKNTKTLIEETFYFSPYKKTNSSSNQKIENLKKEAINFLKKENYSIIREPVGENQEKLNSWWKKIRFIKSEN